MSSTAVSSEASSEPDADAAPPPPSNPIRKRGTLVPWLLLSPAGVTVLLITIVPIAFLIFASFTDYNQRSLFTGEYSYVGWDQYAKILSSPAFWASVWRTVWFTAAMVIGSVVIGVLVAELLARINTTMRYLTTIVLILAWAMPNVASSMVWNWLFQPGYGVINWMLTKLRIFGDMTNTSWSNDPLLAYIAIWLLIVWQAVPFIALTVYASLSQLPRERVEAAQIDGASEWRIWRSITLPFIKPTLLLVTILSIIWDTNVFNQIWLVSAGGPDEATSTLGIYTFKTAFVGFRIGTGAAISVVTTVLLIGVTAIYIRNLIRSGEDL